MSEGGHGTMAATGKALTAVDLLVRAVALLLAEDPVELPGPVALERLRTLLSCAERLHWVRLMAVRDMDSRELYALDAAGSARGWLRRLPGGEDGQVTLARRLAQRPVVSAALAEARVGLRGAAQLCTALDSVPADLDDELVAAVVRDGIGRMLLEHTGGTPEDDDAAAAVEAQRASDAALLEVCCADVTVAPAARVEPAFVLLAERLSPAELASALRLLLDPLQPDGTDASDSEPYYLELRTLRDGDVDVRGLLDPETGQSLAAEIERRLAAARAPRSPGDGSPDPSADDVDTSGDAVLADGAPTADAEIGGAWTADTATAEDDLLSASEQPGTDTDPPTADEPSRDTAAPADDDPLRPWDEALADADARAARRAARPGGGLGRADRGPDAPLRSVPVGRQRHDALRALLQDAAAVTEPGQPAPCSLTVIATLDAVEARLGALPAQLATTGGGAVPLRAATLQRLGCASVLDAVLLDARGNPVGASSTRRMPNRRERCAMRAAWGSTCAVHGCHGSRTVPHHVEPWWLSGRTRLRDLVPLCTSCHHDLHEGHRTLRLRDGRLIDDRGWVTQQVAAA